MRPENHAFISADIRVSIHHDDELNIDTYRQKVITTTETYEVERIPIGVSAMITMMEKNIDRRHRQ